MADGDTVLRQREVAYDRLESVFQILVVHRLRLLDQRVDHIYLTSECYLLPQEPPQLQTRRVGVVVCLYGAASGRQLVYDRDVEVAVEGHGQRARYGRGGHDQNVWRAVVLGPEARALLHTETVLLVDYDISQIGEAYVVLDQGMRADEYVDFARGYALDGAAPLGRLRCPRKYGYIEVHTLREAAYGCEVLPCEYLRRGHHAGLVAVVHSQQHRHERHHRLAAADIPLKQTVHLESRDGILTYLAYDAFLRRSEFEWQTVVVEFVE